MEELWKDIPGYDGDYQVSNTGKIRSLHWNRSSCSRELTQYTQNGYKLVTIRRNKRGKNFLVHRLVASAFVQNPKNLEEVNHIDGNKGNNVASNLEWVSRKGNVSHAIENKLRRKAFANKWMCENVGKFTVDGTLVDVYPSQRTAARECNLCQARISAACASGKPYAGYLWKIIYKSPTFSQ